MTCSLRAVFASLVLLVGTVASAHADQMFLEPSPAASCLILTKGSADKPEYPQEMLDSRKAETVSIRMTFRSPDASPKVEVLNDSPSEQFIEAVRQYAKGLRAPCVQAGDAPVALTQEFVFDPMGGRKVMSSMPEDADATSRQAMADCLAKVNPDFKMRFPVFDRSRDEDTRILVRLTFQSPDKAPELEWLAAPEGRKSMRNLIQEDASNLRIPCMKGAPIVATRLYHFMLEGASRKVLKDMTLRTLVGAAKAVPRPAYFDFGTMNCPFDVRLTYYQPYSANRVSEFDTSLPARKPLLAWLSQVKLNLTEKANLAVVGEDTIISIPCGHLDI